MFLKGRRRIERGERESGAIEGGMEGEREGERDWREGLESRTTAFDVWVSMELLRRCLSNGCVSITETLGWSSDHMDLAVTRSSCEQT
jgi:hypothetical protein